MCLSWERRGSIDVRVASATWVSFLISKYDQVQIYVYTTEWYDDKKNLSNYLTMDIIV